MLVKQLLLIFVTLTALTGCVSSGQMTNNEAKALSLYLKEKNRGL